MYSNVLDIRSNLLPRHESNPITFCTVCRQLENGPGVASATGFGHTGASAHLGGVHALFGPSDPFLGAHIESICEALHLPYIQQRIDYHTSGDVAADAAAANRMGGHRRQQQQQQRRPYTTYGRQPPDGGQPPVSSVFSINLHPSQRHINQAYYDLISYLNWTRLAVVYENDYGAYYLCYRSVDNRSIQSIN